jgi:hypothetical protein
LIITCSLLFNQSLLAAHTPRSPFGQLSFWCHSSHPSIRYTSWLNRKQTRYIASAPLPERIALCLVVSNMGRSATSVLLNSAVAQAHLHQHRRLQLSKPRKPHRPPNKTNRQSQQANPSHSWVSRTRPRRLSRSTSHLRLPRSAPMKTRPNRDHAHKPRTRSKHGKIANSVRYSACH